MVFKSVEPTMLWSNFYFLCSKQVVDLWSFFSVLPKKPWQFLQYNSHSIISHFSGTFINWVHNILFLNVFLLFFSVIKVPFRNLSFLSFVVLSSFNFGIVFPNICNAKMHSCLNYRRIILLCLSASSGIGQGTFLLQNGSGKCNPIVLFIVTCGNDRCMFVSAFRIHRECYRSGVILMLHIFVITFFFKKTLDSD